MGISPPCRPAQSGFTLIELLVTLVLVGLISAVLMSTIQFGLGAWRRTRNSDQQDEARAAIDFIYKQLSNTYSGYASATPGSNVLNFAGYADHVTFDAAMPQSILDGAIARQQIRILPGAGGPKLVFGWDSDLSTRAEDDPAAFRFEVLAGNIESIELSYYGKVRDRENVGWASEWVGREELPTLIKFILRSVDQKGHDSLALIVQPRLSANVECIWDSFSQKCQHL